MLSLTFFRMEIIKSRSTFSELLLFYSPLLTVHPHCLYLERDAPTVPPPCRYRWFVKTTIFCQRHGSPNTHFSPGPAVSTHPLPYRWE